MWFCALRPPSRDVHEPEPPSAPLTVAKPYEDTVVWPALRATLSLLPVAFGKHKFSQYERSSSADLPSKENGRQPATPANKRTSNNGMATVKDPPGGKTNHRRSVIRETDTGLSRGAFTILATSTIDYRPSWAHQVLQQQAGTKTNTRGITRQRPRATASGCFLVQPAEGRGSVRPLPPLSDALLLRHASNPLA